MIDLGDKCTAVDPANCQISVAQNATLVVPPGEESLLTFDSICPCPRAHLCRFPSLILCSHVGLYHDPEQDQPQVRSSGGAGQDAYWVSARNAGQSVLEGYSIEY